MLPRQYHSEQDLRKHQIDTLKIFNENVVEISENNEYRVDFTSGSLNMSLNILLSPDFPNEKPSLYVNPTILHPWVAENSNQVMGAPGLLNYSIHSDLGRVVQAIVREFQRTVPQVVQRSSENGSFSPQSLIQELAELSIEELQEINDNPDLQDKLLENNPVLVQLDLEAEEVLSSIETIAQENIAKQQTLDDLKTEVIDRISTIVQMKMNYEELNRKHARLSENYDPHRIKECLKEAAAKADEEAELIAEQFLLGEINVDTFVTKFAEKRALGQARRAREERLAHQLAQLDRATT